MSVRVRVTSLAVTATALALVLGPVATASAASPPQAKWTVMVYMSGDNNLEDYIVKDLELELSALGSTANVQVTALADRGPGYDKSRGDWQTTKLFHPTQGMIADTAHQVADWGERDMGSAQTLAEFVSWSKTNYPAAHYALYFWGHGWGWHPDWTMEDDTPSGDGLDPDEVKSVFPQLGFIEYDLAKQVNAQLSDATLKAKGTAVMNAVDAVVLHRRFTGKAYNMVHGITITGITRSVERNADWTYYHTLDFAQSTGWDEFEDVLAS